jgi:SAM-dependent methyltransferase
MYSTSHKNRGQDYHDKFDNEFVRSLNWIIEKKILTDALRGSDRVLDVATGTGRVSAHVKQVYAMADVTGIDISSSMLKIAIARNANIRFIEADFTDSSVLSEKYDAITSFRFLPNADLSLMKKSIVRMSELVNDGGIIVINNHRSLNSLSNRLKRLLKKRGGVVGRYDSEIEDEFFRNGFTLKHAYSISIFPLGYEPYRWLRFPIKVLELMNYKLLSRHHRLGQNNVLIFEKEHG